MSKQQYALGQARRSSNRGLRYGQVGEGRGKVLLEIKEAVAQYAPAQPSMVGDIYKVAEAPPISISASQPKHSIGVNGVKNPTTYVSNE